MNAKQAIKRSISHNEIVTLEYNAEDKVTLKAECKDSAFGSGQMEFWGTYEDGSDWRVHMAVADSTREALGALDVDPENKITAVRGVNRDGSEWWLSIGDRVEIEADGGDPDSADSGRIVEFQTEQIAVVAWDSGVTTPADVARLTHE